MGDKLLETSAMTRPGDNDHKTSDSLQRTTKRKKKRGKKKENGENEGSKEVETNISVSASPDFVQHRLEDVNAGKSHTGKQNSNQSQPHLQQYDFPYLTPVHCPQAPHDHPNQSPLQQPSIDQLEKSPPQQSPPDQSEQSTLQQSTNNQPEPTPPQKSSFDPKDHFTPQQVSTDQRGPTLAHELDHSTLQPSLSGQLEQSFPAGPEQSPLPDPSPTVPDEEPQRRADPNKLSLLTWNVDGLDMEDVKERFQHLIGYLIECHPDVVLLQEVIPPLLKALKEVLKPYHVLQGNKKGYFTVILLRKSRVQLLESSIVNYPTTNMQRNLLIAHGRFLGRPLCLMTSHMESMKGNSKERVSQLQQVWKSMTEQPDDRTVIFGGDTNLRDKEVSQLFGLPPDIRDVWESLDQPTDCAYTWDLATNDNKTIPFPARLRFDRLFLRQASKGWRATAEGMTLVGMERLDCGRFISDHWGILCSFTLEPTGQDPVEGRRTGSL